MVYSLNLTFIANRNNSTGIDLAPGETIYFGSLEFTADCFGRMSLSPEGDDPGAIFIGMMHNGSPSLHTVLEESFVRGSMTSDERGSSRSPGPRGCNMVTLTVPITTIVDISYVAPQAHEVVNVALHREYSLGIIFIFSQGRNDLYHV
jgi:hypothetical protein